MQRLLVVLIVVVAVATYGVRCLPRSRFEDILASTANATQEIQRRWRATGTHASQVEVTVLALPSGRPLGNALVTFGLVWRGLPLVSAHTNDAGTAYLSMGTGQLELARPVHIRVIDALGRRAFSGAVLLDRAFLLTVPDLAAIDVVQEQSASPAYDKLVLFSEPRAGVSVPQFLDDYALGTAAATAISGYWRGAKRLHYSFALAGGVLRGWLPLDDLGTGTLRLPHAATLLPVRVVGAVAPVAGADVELHVQNGDTTFMSTRTADPSGACDVPLPWASWDNANLRVTSHGYHAYQMPLEGAEVGEEVVCHLKHHVGDSKLSGLVVREDGIPLPDVRVTTFVAATSKSTVHTTTTTTTDEMGAWQLDSSALENCRVRLTRHGYLTLEAPCDEVAGGSTAVMTRGCAIAVAPYGHASNLLYSALPIRYLLYRMSTGHYVTAHSNAPYTFASVLPGWYCLNVMVGDCVAYGKTLVEVRDEERLEVSVPCVDPGEFRIIVRNYSGLEPPRVVVDGLPGDIVDHWGGTHAIEPNGNGALLRVCAFGTQCASLTLTNQGHRKTIEVHSTRDTTVVWQ